VALRNPRLGSSRDLTYAVQMIVDRLVFLRICEDRGIEPFGQLRDAAAGAQVYVALQERFQRADARYNSGLFHFSAERGREAPDDLTPGLTVDDAVLKKIIASLYYPSPYQFREMGADILGSVYERFLGSVIRLTPAHQARVEQKPEVRKAGGVYYTPRYIVDYIVEHTVGALCRGNTPAHIAGLRFLDPACGSGSFLLGAYQWLLDYHLQWYGEHPAERQSRDRTYRRPDGELALTREEKARLLTANLYGVDIDAQAVEVTRLSLCLKLLEGETEGTLSGQMALLAERALPDLAANIKCGNSLIGPDFYDGQLTLLDEEEQYRINVFDWRAEFPQIMAAGGFDAVIGNPPYVFGRDWRALNIGADQRSYFERHYTWSPYQLDMFSLFMNKAHDLACLGGRAGLIVPNVWLNNIYSSVTRSCLLRNSTSLTLLEPADSVFEGITVDTVVYTYTKSAEPGSTFLVCSLRAGADQAMTAFPVDAFSSGERPISFSLTRGADQLLEHIRRSHAILGSMAEITRGVHPYRTGRYGQSAFGQGPQTSRDVQERPYHSREQRAGYRPFIYGRDLARYAPLASTEYVRYGPWLAEPRKPTFFEGERIYSRKILADRLIVTITADDSVADQQVYITKPVGTAVSPLYLVGVLGSRLMGYYIRSYFGEKNDAFPQIKVTQLRSLPIRIIDFSSPADVARHDQMVSLVERMLALHKDLAAAATPVARNLLQRQIDATDRQIDRLVYALYDLTPEEIAIVEGA
jgi:hypothetical protein